MTLISETKTYDTFLATTRGGALYTIHIPADTRLHQGLGKVPGTFRTPSSHCGASTTLRRATANNHS